MPTRNEVRRSVDCQQRLSTDKHIPLKKGFPPASLKDSQSTGRTKQHKETKKKKKKGE
jgi:hypothetical protein